MRRSNILLLRVMLYYYPGPICAYYLSRRVLSRNVNWRITVCIWQSITSGFPCSSLHFIHKDRAWDPESLLRGLLGPDTVTSSGGPGWSRCPGSRQVQWFSACRGVRVLYVGPGSSWTQSRHRGSSRRRPAPGGWAQACGPGPVTGSDQ